MRQSRDRRTASASNLQFSRIYGARGLIKEFNVFKCFFLSWLISHVSLNAAHSQPARTCSELCGAESEAQTCCAIHLGKGGRSKLIYYVRLVNWTQIPYNFNKNIHYLHTMSSSCGQGTQIYGTRYIILSMCTVSELHRKISPAFNVNRFFM